MACLSCQAKIEGITERVSVMKEKKEKIDLLFERNAAEQLAGVDWNELNTAISSRLDQAENRRTSSVGFPTVFKVAAGFVAAAAVVLIAVMVRTEKPADMQLEEGRRAVVKFIEREGTASIKIKHSVGESEVWVDVGGSDKRVAKCDIEIIDLNGDLKKEREQAAWIIISRPERVLADNGINRDVMSMICLF